MFKKYIIFLDILNQTNLEIFEKHVEKNTTLETNTQNEESVIEKMVAPPISGSTPKRSDANPRIIRTERSGDQSNSVAAEQSVVNFEITTVERPSISNTEKSAKKSLEFNCTS
uniref:Uncharacterized protein n=1 Tax=Clytia hemisphaerica TaxID=252671 RepID=A0A7M5UDU4_9CNID